MLKKKISVPKEWVDKSLERCLLKAKRYLCWWINHGYYLTKDRKGEKIANLETEKLRKIMETGQWN